MQKSIAAFYVGAVSLVEVTQTATDIRRATDKRSGAELIAALPGLAAGVLVEMLESGRLTASAELFAESGKAKSAIVAGIARAEQKGSATAAPIDPVDVWAMAAATAAAVYDAVLSDAVETLDDDETVERFQTARDAAEIDAATVERFNKLIVKAVGPRNRMVKPYELLEGLRSVGSPQTAEQLRVTHGHSVAAGFVRLMADITKANNGELSGGREKSRAKVMAKACRVIPGATPSADRLALKEWGTMAD